MLHPLRKYLLKKSWDREFTPKMAGENVFAFGKKAEDRWNCVTYPKLVHALSNSENIIWLSEGGSDDLHRAMEKYGEGLTTEEEREDFRKYSVKVIDMEACHTIDARAKICDQIIKALKDGHAIIVFQMKRWEEMDIQKVMALHSGYFDAHATPLEEISNRLYIHFCDYMGRIYAAMNEPGGEMPQMSVILHDVCGNICIAPFWLRSKNATFCITMDSRIGFKRWRDRVGANLAATGFIAQIKSVGLRPEMVHWEVQMTVAGPKYVLAVDWNMDTNNLFQDFFFRIETVLCLGADDLNPAEHKRFVGECMFCTSQVGVGGRYAIEEVNTYAERARHRAVRNETLLCKGNIPENVEEHRIYGAICESIIEKGRCIVEFNNRIRLHHVDGVYFPAAFHTIFVALEWVRTEILSTGMKIEESAIINGDGIFVVTDKDGQSFSISITQIKDEKMAEKYRDKYLIGVLEMGEAESVLDFNRELLGIDDNYGLSLQKEVLADFVCRNGLNGLEYPEEEIDTTEMADDVILEEKPSFEIPEEYRWKPYVSPTAPSGADNHESGINDETDDIILPETGVLFLGGHQNMTKKLKQLFPKWAFMSDDLLNKGTGKYDIIFFWNRHSSHAMAAFVRARTDAADLIYVSSTNIEKLVDEMKEGYAASIREAVVG